MEYFCCKLTVQKEFCKAKYNNKSKQFKNILKLLLKETCLKVVQELWRSGTLDLLEQELQALVSTSLVLGMSWLPLQEQWVLSILLGISDLAAFGL